MKRIFVLALFVIISLSLCACGQNAADTFSSSNGSDSALISNGSTLPVTENADAEEEKIQKAKELEKYDVDLDFSSMNKTMTTAQMSSIYNSPGDYIGKTVRLTATYQKFHSDETGKDYNIAFGYDDTCCCAAWNIEFYGDKVPENIEDYSTVSMVGKLAQYDEGGQKYMFIDVEHFVA